jgi:hypothetical protein
VWFFANFWRCLEVLTVLFALSSQVLYTTQRSYTEIAWEKLEQEDYPAVLKNNPRTESIVGDISAASEAHQWQLASLGCVIFFSMVKFMKILSGTKFFEMTKGTYFEAGWCLAANVLFIFVVYSGFIHVSLILFKRSADFTGILRSAQMIMGYCAGMYTSTDLREMHPFRGGWFLWWQHLFINCILMNTLAVLLENSFRESKDLYLEQKEFRQLTRKSFRTKFANRKENLKRIKKSKINKSEKYRDLPRDDDGEMF